MQRSEKESASLKNMFGNVRQQVGAQRGAGMSNRRIARPLNPAKPTNKPAPTVSAKPLTRGAPSTSTNSKKSGKRR